MQMSTRQGSFTYTFEEMGGIDLLVHYEFDFTPGTRNEPDEMGDIKITSVALANGAEIDIQHVAVKSKSSTWVSLEAELIEQAGEQAFEAEVADNA
jgi:hypothetical protein